MRVVPVHVALEGQFARDLAELAIAWRAEQPPDPRLVVLNERLAGDLALDAAWLRTCEGLGLLTGSLVPADSTPVAQAGRRQVKGAPAVIPPRQSIRRSDDFG